MSESVAQRLAAPRRLPNTPPLTVWLNGGVTGFNGQANGFENLNCRRGPQSLFACPLHSSHPHSGTQGKGTTFGDQRITALVSCRRLRSSRTSGFKMRLHVRAFVCTDWPEVDHRDPPYCWSVSGFLSARSRFPPSRPSLLSPPPSSGTQAWW